MHKVLNAVVAVVLPEAHNETVEDFKIFEILDGKGSEQVQVQLGRVLGVLLNVLLICSVEVMHNHVSGEAVNYLLTLGSIKEGSVMNEVLCSLLSLQFLKKLLVNFNALVSEVCSQWKTRIEVCEHHNVSP